MSRPLAQLQEATIKQHCKTLRMPMMASHFNSLAEQAVREKKTHAGYLEAPLTAEIDERERNTIERRIKEAHLPRVKTLEEFDYTQSPLVTAAKMLELAEGGYIDRAEPILLIGECGTGKMHLLSGLCIAACRQKRRVRFTTAAALVNELVEAKHQLQLRRVMTAGAATISSPLTKSVTCRWPKSGPSSCSR
jgi:DNA replication protein DnaC